MLRRTQLRKMSKRRADGKYVRRKRSKRKKRLSWKGSNDRRDEDKQVADEKRCRGKTR